MLGRLLEDFEQRVGCFLHERTCREDVEGTPCLRGPAIDARDDRADLTEFDEQLRRVGRDDEQLRVGLDEDAGVFLIRIAHLFSRGNGFGEALVQSEGGADALAVRADAAGVRQAVRGDGREAIRRLRQQHGERVLARAARAAQDHGRGQTAGGEGLAQTMHRRLIAQEVGEVHDCQRIRQPGF